MGEDGEIEFSGIRITSPGKVVFKRPGITKSGLADYYAAVADLMLPHIANRPLSLVRCPQGQSGKCFFQKHDTGGFPKAMHHVMIAESDGGKEQYFYIDDLPGHRRRRADGNARVPHLGLPRRRRSRSPTASSSTSTRMKASDSRMCGAPPSTCATGSRR